MEQQTEKPKRRPSIEVRCPKCRMREIWHHLPRAATAAAGADTCSRTTRTARSGRGRKRTHDEELGAVLRHARAGHPHGDGVPLVALLHRSFCEEADYLEWLKAEYDDGTVEWEER